MVACILHTSAPARACGVAVPPGSVVRVLSERAVIVWDAERKVEHFVLEPTFEGDARSFGFLVPTPTVPSVAKIDDELLDRVSALMPIASAAGSSGGGAAPGEAKGGVQVLQRVTIDGFEMVTLRSAGADELGAWLGKNGYVDRPELRRWTRRYLAKAWLVNALKYAGGAEGDPRAIETPALRLSFAIDRPFYPYTEPPQDPQALRGLAARRPPALTDLGVVAPPTEPLLRSLDVWVFAQEPVDAFQNRERLGPPRVASARVEGELVAGALGDTKGWPLDARGRTWTVTHFHEEAPNRTAFEDVVFAPGEASVARPSDSSHAPSPARWLALLFVACVVAGVALVLRDGAEVGRR